MCVARNSLKVCCTLILLYYVGDLLSFVVAGSFVYLKSYTSMAGFCIYSLLFTLSQWAQVIFVYIANESDRSVSFVI
jgi:hypothetical protein